MADKKTGFGHGLGDLTNLMHNQNVSDLSWLSVDEAEYRAAEALPKQNLDIIPELVAALVMEDDVPHVIPMKPHVMVNRNPNDYHQIHQADLTAPIRNRVAKMVMMGLSREDVQGRLSLEFAPAELRYAADAIAAVEDERGLLGNVYVDASHFPNAARDEKERKFARVAGKDAIFVIGGCGGCDTCNCHETGMCSTFGGKRVVSEVPYGMNVAAHYAPRLASEKRPLDMPSLGTDELPVSGREWKEIIRSSFRRTPIASRDGSVNTTHTQYAPAKPTVTKKDVADFVARREASVSTPAPTVEYVKHARRMMLGHDDRAALVASTDSNLRQLAGEFGILGHTYLDMDLLGGCRNTLALMEKRDIAPEYVIRRSAVCQMCKDAPDGACAGICGNSTFVASKPEITRAVFASALERAVYQGRVASHQAAAALTATNGVESNWTKLTASANLYSPPANQEVADYSGINAKAHYGEPGRSETATAEMDPEEIRRTVSHLMNTGLSGKSLQSAILQRYSRDDLRQAPEVGRRASADDGVQGHYFVDPTAYRDYGKGCGDGSKHFRKQGAPYVLAASGCTGCTLQTAPGWCSKYSKGLIRQVPTQVRDRVAASKRYLPVVQPAVENPVEKYELSSEIEIDLKGSKSREIDVKITGGSLDD